MQSKSINSKIKRTSGVLADGRAIHYYDLGFVGRNAIDRRAVEAAAPIGELRHDALKDDWVAVAAHRQSRTFMPPKELCPLCPTSVDADTQYLTEIPEADYQVVVFDNRFPALTRPPDGFVVNAPLGVQLEPTLAAGKCEVVCFSSDHSASFRDLNESQVRVVLEAWKDRTRVLAELSDVVHVFPFENRGEEIGVTLPHPHGQIYGYSYLPMTVKTMMRAAVAFFEQTGLVLMDEIVAREIRDEMRVIAQNSEWVAYVPYAARYPYEFHVAPLRSVMRLPDLDETASASFGEVYLEALRRLDGVFGVDMPYIAAWHQAPLVEGAEQMRLHLQVTSIRRSADKIKYLAGSESAMGAFLGDVTPEAAAAAMRAVIL